MPKFCNNVFRLIWLRYQQSSTSFGFKCDRLNSMTFRCWLVSYALSDRYICRVETIIQSPTLGNRKKWRWKLFTQIDDVVFLAPTNLIKRGFIKFWCVFSTSNRWYFYRFTQHISPFELRIPVKYDMTTTRRPKVASPEEPSAKG